MYQRLNFWNSNSDPATERAASPHVTLIKADHAYRRGWTGRGVIIGQYEEDIDDSHPELEGHLSHLQIAIQPSSADPNISWSMENTIPCQRPP